MSNVVELNPAKNGDLAFMLCPCKPEDPQPYLVVAIVGLHPIIAGLLCPECDKQLTVVNGIVNHG